MTSPYLFTPANYHSYQPTPYIDPYRNTPQNSPYIPSNLQLPPASPYHSPHPSESNIPLPRYAHFEEERPPWTVPPRPRRPSWHAGVAAPSSPVVYTPQYLYPTPTYSHHRRHSFGTPHTPYSHLPYEHAPVPVSSPWHYRPPQPPQPRFQIHPYLNGESPRSDFYYDLSHPNFCPTRIVGPGQSVQLSVDELNQPATHPAITRLRIVCDIIPQWPTELAYDPRFAGGYSPGGSMQPISVSDVLVALHKTLHTRISQIDWARLSVSEETAVGKAYTKRCRSVPSTYEFEASQGVRRVDYLLNKCIFKGLVRAESEDGIETLRLVLGERNR